ncbi:MAG: helix-turn-helix domain-containing protein [Actinomycetota bacterium]
MPTATLDDAFEALANGHRRDIVAALSAQPMETPALLARYEISRQALNRHVQILEQAGLVRRERRGRVQRLELVGDAVAEVIDWLSTVRLAWESSLDQLGRVLAESTEEESP